MPAREEGAQRRLPRKGRRKREVKETACPRIRFKGPRAHNDLWFRVQTGRANPVLAASAMDHQCGASAKEGRGESRPKKADRIEGEKPQIFKGRKGEENCLLRHRGKKITAKKIRTNGEKREMP